MPTFNAPYGTKDQHVFSPARNLGYHYIVARLVDGGMLADYIQRACEEAHEAGAPKDALYVHQGQWIRRHQVANVMVGRKYDTYTRALLKYETELKAERKAQG